MQTANYCHEKYCGHLDKCDTVIVKINVPVFGCQKYRVDVQKEELETTRMLVGLHNQTYESILDDKTFQSTGERNKFVRVVMEVPNNLTSSLSEGNVIQQFLRGLKGSNFPPRLNLNPGQITSASGNLFATLSEKIEASCEFYNSHDIILQNLKREECISFPGLCDVKIGQVVHRDSLI
jgi:hypothetical protein